MSLSLSRLRPRALVTIGALVVVALAMLAPAPAPAAVATAAKSCSSPEYPGSGYFTSLKVSKTSCSSGKKVALGYYECRIDNGGRKGRCTKRVRGYRCTEKRSSISTQINAIVTCKKGSAKITHSYQQNLD